MTRFIPAAFALALLSAFMAAPSGCGAPLATVLPDVIKTVTDASLILDRVESYVDRVFGMVPNPEYEAKVGAALDKARTALSVALRASEGAQAANDGDAAKALDDFRAAYAELMKLAAPLGAWREGQPPPLGSGEHTGPIAPLVVPDPMAMRE